MADTRRPLPFFTDFLLGLHPRTHPLCRSDAERGPFLVGGPVTTSFDSRSSPRTESLVAAAVQWAERSSEGLGRIVWTQPSKTALCPRPRTHPPLPLRCLEVHSRRQSDHNHWGRGGRMYPEIYRVPWRLICVEVSNRRTPEVLCKMHPGGGSRVMSS